MGDEAREASPSERRRITAPLRFGGRLLARRVGERESLILAMICALDMYTTLWWVVTGHAVEANRLLSWTFEKSPVLFVLVKAVFYVPALVLAPRLARKHPLFTVWLLRGIIAAYLWIYISYIQ